MPWPEDEDYPDSVVMRWSLHPDGPWGIDVRISNYTTRTLYTERVPAVWYAYMESSRLKLPLGENW
jgi:hypothetical protein